MKAQEKKTGELAKTVLLNGITVHFDVASIASSMLVSNESYSLEGGVSVDIKHKYYPVVELGFAGASKYSNDDIHYTTNAPFGRIGVDINLLKQKPKSKPTNNKFIAGVRLGFSNYKYDVTNVTIPNLYWGGTEILNYNNNIATKVWYEVVAGVQVEVIKNIYMGWTVRNKHLINQDTEGIVNSWYIPGFGQNTTSVWGFNYSIGYHF